MILCFSTSSPWASVAWIAGDGTVLWQAQVESPRAASGACIAMLGQMKDELGVGVEQAELFAADVGPGSFTGVRVGVTLAKTFGYLYSRPVAGGSAFDLVASDKPVALPSKKGEFLLRVPGERPERVAGVPADTTGYGSGLHLQVFPAACGFAKLLERIIPVDAAAFVPEYLIPPSISTPKKPFGKPVASG